MALDQQSNALIKQMQQDEPKPASQIPVEQPHTVLMQMAVALTAPKMERYATEDRGIRKKTPNLACALPIRCNSSFYFPPQNLAPPCPGIRTSH